MRCETELLPQFGNLCLILTADYSCIGHDYAFMLGSPSQYRYMHVYSEVCMHTHRLPSFCRSTSWANLHRHTNIPPTRRAYSACLKESKADSNYHYPRPHRNQRVSERPEIYIDGKQLRIRNGSGRVHGPGNGVLRGKATCGNVGMLHIWWTDAEALVSGRMGIPSVRPKSASARW